MSRIGDELSDAEGIGGVQRLDDELTAGEIAEEADLGLPAAPRPNRKSQPTDSVVPIGCPA